MKEENVLLTAVSANYYPVINYYYTEKEDDKQKFEVCNGISSIEYGTKYFLSKHKIDRIVAIVSEEAGAGGKVRLEDNNYSYYEYYKKRISDFLKSEESETDQFFKGINDERKKRIIDIFEKEIIKNSCKEFFDSAKEVIDYFNNQENKKIATKQLEEHIENHMHITGSANTDAEKAVVSSLKDKCKEIISDFVGVGAMQNAVADAIVKRWRESYKKIEYAINNEYANTDEYTQMAWEVLGDCVKEFIKSLFEKGDDKLDDKLRILYRISNQAQVEVDKIKSFRINNEWQYIIYCVYNNVIQDSKLTAVEGNKDFEAFSIVDDVVVVDDGKIKFDNVKGLVDTIMNNNADESEGQPGCPSKHINLYVDMQGGDRTRAYIRNAVWTMLENEGRLTLQEIVSASYDSTKVFHHIENQTIQYKISDLVSGLDAFVNYGKAGTLKKYLEEVVFPDNDLEDPINKDPRYIMVRAMNHIDNDISICDIDALRKSIKELAEAIDSIERDRDNASDFVSDVFDVIITGIKSDYGRLLNITDIASSDSVSGSIYTESDFYIDLIEWCNRKGFVQQALTIIENKMPKVFFEKGLIRLRLNQNESECEKWRNGLGTWYNDIWNNVLYGVKAVPKLEQDDAKKINAKVITDILAKIYPKVENQRSSFYERLKDKSGQTIGVVYRVYNKDKKLYLDISQSLLKWLVNKDIEVKSEQGDILDRESVYDDVMRLLKKLEGDKLIKEYCKYRAIYSYKEKEPKYPESQYKYSGENECWNILFLLDEALKDEALKDEALNRGEDSKLKHRTLLSLYTDDDMWKKDKNKLLTFYKDDSNTIQGYLDIVSPEMDLLLSLQFLLKSERNAANHAGSFPKRFRIDVLKKVISEYIIKVNDISKNGYEYKDSRERGIIYKNN